jgi:putative holliday junction resolvase
MSSIIINIKDFLPLLISGQRLLALDFGTKKIGLALSDTSKTIASPFKVLIRQNFKKDVAEILAHINMQLVCGLVIGWPLQMSGQQGDMCVLVKEFAEKIIAKYPIPIYLQDERLSSKAANRVLIEFNVNRLQRNLLDDKIAACFMLQGVLDQIKNLDNYHG